jgi:nicotinate-nucleotide adenylyltransferase
MSVAALETLGLDEVWWLVSPQNPLKPVEGMAPLAARLESAGAMARHPRIRVTAIEAELQTQLTVDTVSALRARYPHVRFLWLMGADNLLQFHRWTAWRDIARMVPIVVMARPLYIGRSQSAPAMAWLRRFRRRNPAGWRTWHLPAISIVSFGLDQTSATAIRRRTPEWAQPIPATHANPPNRKDDLI